MWVDTVLKMVIAPETQIAEIFDVEHQVGFSLSGSRSFNAGLRPRGRTFTAISNSFLGLSGLNTSSIKEK